MVDANRRHGFDSLGDVDPGGPLAAWAAAPAGQAAIRVAADKAPGLKDELGFPLGLDTRQAGGAGTVTTFRLGPDYWLAVSDSDAGLGRRLEDTEGLHALDQTSARARLRLRGPAARDLLAVGASYDLRPKSFPAGAFAQTAIGNATAILHARETDLFDIYVARSFAASWLHWLDHAGREFGLEFG